MGLPFRIVLYAADGAAATNAAQAAFHRIRQLNDILTDYDAGSETSQLSRSSGNGQWTGVSADLWRVLARSQAMARATEGAFDVTVGPCVQLWRKARRERELPDQQRLAAALRSVGYRHVRLARAGRRVRLMVPNMRLDFGGIAKGYAVDEALWILRRRGIQAALVSGGGDLAVSGPPPGRVGWTVEIGRHDSAVAPPPIQLLLRDAALATSGDVFQHLEIGGVRYSHIVDPRTGVGLTHQAQVSVIAADCTTADSWATALSVLEPQEGFKRIERHSALAARVQYLSATGLVSIDSSRFATLVREQGVRR